MKTFLAIADFVFMLPVAVIIAATDAVWGVPTGYDRNTSN